MRILNEFRHPFQNLSRRLSELPIPIGEQTQLIADLLHIQEEAEQLATQDCVTFALNRRGAYWYTDGRHVRSVAKIDMYDMRQANKVYGVAAVDTDLRRLSYLLRQIFSRPAGDFVRRSAGSDEFLVLSTRKSIPQLRRLIHQLYQNDKHDALIPWDFGVGLSEAAADENLQMRRRRIRPTVIRQVHPDNHSEIPRDNTPDRSIPELDEFRQPYALLAEKLRYCQLSKVVLESLIAELRALQVHVESEITADELTGALNWIGRRWYLRFDRIKAVALTDMHDMHEGNLRFGAVAIDQDLQRFSTVLCETFKREEGFLVLRSVKAGDEFQIVSCDHDVAALRERFRDLHWRDRSAGLLRWHFGVGRDEEDALRQLYVNIVQSPAQLPRMNHMIAMPAQHSSSYYLIVRPDQHEQQLLLDFAGQIASPLGGQRIDDLHCTIQSFNGDVSVSDLSRVIEAYCRTLRRFDVAFERVARVNTANLPGRLWLLVRKSQQLMSLYHDLMQIGGKLSLHTYPYPVEEWRPHMKIVVLPQDTPPTPADSAFGLALDIKFRVQKLALTRQVGPYTWEDVAEYAIT